MEPEGSLPFRIIVGNPEGKRPRRRWVDNIKMDLREIGWDSMFTSLFISSSEHQ
jgi:hypothetical protein